MIDHIIKPVLAAQPDLKPHIDSVGNMIYDVGGPSPTLFSAHVDTVHYQHGLQDVWGDLDLMYLWKEDGECLGADNAAGCWLLTELIRAGVPGLYIFHQGEERGGIGSSYIAEHCQDRLKGKHHAIAFDRRKTASIITEMSAGRTCSDEFATAFAELLGMGHKLDNTGSFTDTANYRKLIAECTNVSVGYDCEHSGAEVLDADYLFQLRDKLIEVGHKLIDLPVQRDPLREEPRKYYCGTGYGGGYGTLYDSDYDAYEQEWTGNANKSKGQEVADAEFDFDDEDIKKLRVPDPEDQPWEAASQVFEILMLVGVITCDQRDPEGDMIQEGLFALASQEPKQFRSYTDEVCAQYFRKSLGEWVLPDEEPKL